MKKFVPILLLMSLLFTLFSSAGHAAEVVPKLYLNGALLDSKVAPQIVDNKYTLVPIRLVSESIGYKVGWSSATQTVTVHNGSDSIVLTINQNVAFVNNEQVMLDTPALLQKGTTLIPLRFVGESLGMKVNWDQSTKSVQLFKEEEPAPTPTPSTDPVVTQPDGVVTDISYDNENAIIIHYEGSAVYNQPFKLESPKRIVIDIPKVSYSDTLLAQLGSGQINLEVGEHPYLSGIRYSLFSSSPATVRIVLDLKADADVDVMNSALGEIRINVIDPLPVEATPTPTPTPSATPTPTAGPTLPANGVYSIVIDAGHGGSDPGAKGINGRWEKEFNLSLALKVKDLLDKESKIKAYLSRPDDNYVKLEDRVKFAENLKANLFLSIHANSNPSSAANGTETYYTRASSKAFADAVHKQFATATGLKDRGVKQQSLHVTRETTMPAILLEAGFLSNADDYKKLFDEAVQNKIAAGIVAGIKDYLKLS
ncbi:N-acetylmuramoyl-L-alanine amidase [Paenibacillus algorifonticola]|uniref:N-acetylmuramoyl-L-alanine amidase n=1 Tax=Paenibacillus algorifonticola TaxID=684063 RepID=A0A1I2C8L0_9BACL|nr:N-acetylmuramoyl-L-alanine amidase family protein [Paenibacillus algorifonticola]SFE64010.1 N-acetylmuramoyl-L-alanine amidase [Paenibacillus algorifonticola]